MGQLIVELCEAAMLILFGCSWPFNIIKSYRSRTAKGKSLGFEIIIVTGYIIGLIGKLVSWRLTGHMAYSFWFYIVDIILVSIDIRLYFRNKKLDQAAGSVM